MPVIYDAATKTARMQAVLDKIDAGSGPGTMEVCTAAYASVLRVITLDDPCGSVSGNVATLAGFPKTDGDGPAGTAAVARIKDSSGNVRITGLTVGTSGADVIVETTTLAVDQDLVVQSASITHAADPS